MEVNLVVGVDGDSDMDIDDIEENYESVEVRTCEEGAETRISLLFLR